MEISKIISAMNTNHLQSKKLNICLKFFEDSGCDDDDKEIVKVTILF
jgi:hypothetical protein